MASINSYNYVVATVNGVDYKFGSLSTPTAITASGDDAYVFTQSVAISTASTLWSRATAIVSGPSDFDFMLIASDFDLDVELTCDVNGTVGARYNLFEISGSGTAGTWGVPLILTSDDNWPSDYTSAWGAGTTGKVINCIKVKNWSTSQAAQVLLMLFT